MRSKPRPRRYLPRRLIRLLKLLGFRYDSWRDAYILVLVGHRFGPVIRERGD